MMLCADLPDEKRAQLIEDGDLESDDDDFEFCVVKFGYTFEPVDRRGSMESQ